MRDEPEHSRYASLIVPPDRVIEKIRPGMIGKVDSGAFPHRVLNHDFQVITLVAFIGDPLAVRGPVWIRFISGKCSKLADLPCS